MEGDPPLLHTDTLQTLTMQSGSSDKPHTQCEENCQLCPVHLLLKARRGVVRIQKLNSLDKLFVNDVLGLTSPEAHFRASPGNQSDSLNLVEGRLSGCDQLNGDSEHVWQLMRGARARVKSQMPIGRPSA